MEELKSIMEKLEELKRKLKDLLSKIYVDVYEDELDDIIEQNIDVIKNWDLNELDNLITYLKGDK